MEEGRPAYHPALLLKVWLYAYALGVTSARRLEQRVREELAFRYLAAGAGPDFWTLNQFRTRHARALNDLFTQVVELARSLGMGRLGHVAMDSTRVAANASRDRVETVAKLRAERAKIRRQIRRWQKQCDAQSCEEAAGRQLSGKQMAALEKRLEEIPRCLERLRKSGLKRRSETDPDSRFLRDRKGFTLGYTAEVAVSEDHLIVEQRVGQNATDNATLVPLVETVERRCRERPQKVSAAAVYLSHIIRRGVSMRVPPWSFHGLRATAGMIAFLLLCPSAWGESLTRSDQQSTTGSEQQRDHLWYSQVETRFGGEGLRLFLHREPGPDLFTSPFPTVGCMLPQSQERRRDLKPVLVLDYCYEHGEVKVLSYRPPSPPGDSKSGAGPGASPGVSKDAAAPPASAAHHWYSQLAPEVTSQGLSLRIPIAMRGNWCDIWPEKVAAKNRELVRKASVEARLTIDLCLLHGEVKVLGYLPPGPDVMEALREGDWEAIRVHIRNDPIPSASP